MAGETTQRVGIVVIGRNEGERLRYCLAPLVGDKIPVVYSDSGSTDGSVGLAESLGVEVVALDASAPFTAARGRNAGFRRILEVVPELSYVQFVDGDCELMSNWIATGVSFLDVHADVAVVCGRVRERHADRSIYNLLCDIEWDGPTGEVGACGGNALMRVSAFQAVDGFRTELIAGEEPELCVRMRSGGWRIWRLADDMVWHDANITRFGQWWARTMRTGHSFAEAAHLHGDEVDRPGVHEVRSALFWGLGLPAAGLVLALIWGLEGAAVFLLYPLQVVRLAARGSRNRHDDWWRAFFLVLGKFPEAIGNLKFLAHRSIGKRSGLIEYK